MPRIGGSQGFHHSSRQKGKKRPADRIGTYSQKKKRLYADHYGTYKEGVKIG
jgi:hypothetical protein